MSAGMLFTTLEQQSMRAIWDPSMVAVAVAHGLMVAFGPYNSIRGSIINAVGVSSPALALFVSEATVGWMSAVMGEVAWKGFLEKTLTK